MKRQNKAYIYAIFSVIFWSTAATAFKISLQYQDFLQLLFFASLSSSVALFIIILLQNKLKILINMKTKEFINSMLLGLLNPFLYYIVLFKAYSILPAQIALSLNYLWPITLTILSIFILKQKIKLQSVMAIIISFIGVLIIITNGNILILQFSNTIGIILALSSTIIWAIYWILNIKDRVDSVVRLFLNFLFGFIYILITLFVLNDIKIPVIYGLSGSVYVGLFEMGITFVLWLKALKLSETTVTISNLIYLSPFISLIFIKFILGEDILPSTIFGLVLIITGILLQRKPSINLRR